MSKNPFRSAVSAILAITVGLSFLLSSRPALAVNYDQPFSLTVSPYYLSLNTKPGGTTSDSIKIKNNSSSAITLETGLLRFRAYNDQGTPELLPLEENDPFKNWISFSENQFTIPGGGTKDLGITIKVPADAALGYYYAVTFKKATASAGSETTKLLGSSAVLILLEVTTPNIKKDIQVVSFQADRFVYDFLPVNFSVTLKNAGNIHVAPTGNIFIDQGSQKDIGVINVNKAAGNILPDSTRVFTAPWDDGFLVYNKKKLQWNWANVSHFRIGKYTANLLMVYDNGTTDVPIQGTLTFWVIPWQIILLLLAILLLAGYGLFSIFRRFRIRFRIKR